MGGAAVYLEQLLKMKKHLDDLAACINFYKYVWANISEDERQRLIKEYKELNPEIKLFDTLTC